MVKAIFLAIFETVSLNVPVTRYLGLAGGAAGVEDEEGVLGIQPLGLTLL